MHSRIGSVACLILLAVSAGGGRPSTLAADSLARLTAAPFQPIVKGAGRRGLPAVITEAPRACGGHPGNLRRRGETMARGALHRLARENT